MAKFYELNMKQMSYYSISEVELNRAMNAMMTHEFQKDNDLMSNVLYSKYVTCKKCNTKYLFENSKNIVLFKGDHYDQVEYNTCNENIIKTLVE